MALRACPFPTALRRPCAGIARFASLAESAVGGRGGERPCPPPVASHQHRHQQDQATECPGGQHRDRPKRRSRVEVVHAPQRLGGGARGQRRAQLAVAAGQKYAETTPPLVALPRKFSPSNSCSLGSRLPTSRPERCRPRPTPNTYRLGSTSNNATPPSRGKTTLFSGWGDWQSSEPTLRSAYRGVTRLGMPWVGRSVMWLVYRGSPGGAENSKSRTSTARAITDSSIEKCCPMHPRGPPPNGHHA